MAAYVVFRTAEGKERAISQFKSNKCNRCCLFICCRKAEYKKFEFEDSFPDIITADDPSVILWQNLGVSKSVRRMRTGFIALATIIILVVCCMV